MTIERFDNQHIEDAAALVLAGYAAEREAVAILPHGDGYADVVRREIAGLAGSGLPGVAAIEGGRLVGFLAGYPVDQFFSSRPGAYVPSTGHGAAGEDRRLVLQRLYAAASGLWVGEGRLMHSLSIFAHDREAVDAWYWLGFGLRCVDAVRLPVPAASGGSAALIIRQATPDDADVLFPLHSEHGRYYRNPPLFMPNVDLEDSPEEFRRWLSQPGHHLWAAYDSGRAVSYMRIRRGGGNCFAADNPTTYNVCAAYTTESVRGAGAGAAILTEIASWAAGQGCERIGVDYESFNVFGSRFWGKHFTPYLLSPVRYIDDRIAGDR